MTINDNFSKDSLIKTLGSKTIVLIGLMGSGKSAIGKRLGTALKLPFQDADTQIEMAANMDISEIFETHGEAAFRSGEQKVIERLLLEGPQVLATGGGAWMNPQTRLAAKEHGISVWLDAELDVLMERVLRRSNRPLLQNGNPRETMQNLLQERNPFYAQSDLRIESRNVPHETIVGEIIEALKAHLLVCKQAENTGKK